MVIISFNNKELRDNCASLSRAEAAFGSIVGPDIITALSDAEACGSVQELLDLYDHAATTKADIVNVALGLGFNMSLVAVGAGRTTNPDKGCDWRAVRRLKVMEITKC